MKKYRGAYSLLLAALSFCLLAAAQGEERRPLLSLAKAICEQGEVFAESGLFELFYLRGPFLFVSDGAEMLAMSGRNCHSLRTAEAGSVLLVIGHRRETGAADFYLTSLSGELLQAARGLVSREGGAVFIAVDPSHEVMIEFAAAKAFWLAKFALSPAALRIEE